MFSWFLAWRREAQIEGTWDSVYSEFDFAEMKSQDGAERRYEFSKNGAIFNWRFNWNIEPGEGCINVTEEAYVSPLWFFSASFLLLCCLGSIVIGKVIGGVFSFLLSLVGLLFFVAYVFAINRVIDFGGPVGEFFESQPDQDIYRPYVFLMMALLPPILSVFSTAGMVQYVSLATVFVLISGYAVYSDRAEKLFLEWQVGYVKTLRQFPSIVSDYAVRIITASLPMLLFVIVFREETFILLVEAFPYISTVVYAALGASLLAIFRMGLVYQNKIGETRFKSDGREVSNRLLLGVSTAVTIMIATGFGYLCVLFLNISQTFLAVVPVFPSGLLVLIGLIPAVLLTTGFVYQYWSLLSGLYFVGENVEKIDITDSYQTETATYVLEHDGLYAGAGSFLWRDFIVVSEGMVEELDSGEIDSIVAHEDCHINHREPQLAVFIALLSPLIFMGKNVIYTLFDFRSREFRADKYAAQVSDPDDLREALERLQSVKAERSTQEKKLDSVLPTLSSMDQVQDGEDDSLTEVYLEYYFGDFAVTGIHPSLGERIERLKNA